MRLIHCIFGVFFAIAATASHAAEQVSFKGGSLTYGSGSIDPVSFNGDANDVTIRLDIGVEVAIDHYFVNVVPTGGKTLIKEINIGNVMMTSPIVEGASVAIGGVRVANMLVNLPDATVLNLFDENFSSYIQFPGLSSVSNLDIDLGDGSRVTMDRYYTDATELKIDTPFAFPLTAITSGVIDLTYHPGPTTDPRLLLAMNSMGLDELTMNIQFNGSPDLAHDRVNSYAEMTVAFDQIGTIKLAVDLGLLNDAIVVLEEELERMHSNKLSEDELMDILTEELFLAGFMNSFEFTISDSGGLDSLLTIYAAGEGISKADAVMTLMELLAMSIGPVAPNTYAMLAQPTQSFLEQGGRLSLSSSPSSPVPFATFLAVVAAPDAIASIIGLNVTHRAE
ncbi:MAG: hypothetical protein J4F41_07525 [Alphaproteobacteria bacterium]|nr:hypothetical protein [Alphaproteobacteria bacterium]